MREDTDRKLMIYLGIGGLQVVLLLLDRMTPRGIAEWIFVKLLTRARIECVSWLTMRARIRQDLHPIWQCALLRFEYTYDTNTCGHHQDTGYR